MVLLSICIPTHNREQYLAFALTSIAESIKHTNVCTEVCVSDNASTDNTGQIVAQFRDSNPHIRTKYRRQSTNVGPDRNFLSAVDLASGTYCWLLGSDDALAADAVELVDRELRVGDPDILVLGRIDCDIDLHPLRTTYWIRGREASFSTHDGQALRQWSNRAMGIGALFSYMSVCVFRRSMWCAGSVPAPVLSTAYTHVFCLCRSAVSGAHVRFSAAAPVLCRGGNDSFLTSVASRFLIDVDGFETISRSLPSGSEGIEWFSILRREHPPYRIPHLRASAGRKQWNPVADGLRRIGYGKLIIGVGAVLGRFPKLVAGLVRLKRLVRRVRSCSYRLR